ncbi:hypothetical protein ACB092_12G122400 [Castanea dentata]
MASSVMFHSRFLLAFILLNYLVCLFATAASTGGFTVELIRRDSPKSPFYNADKTTTSRLDKYYTNAAQSQLLANKGEHLMKLTIGTPPVDIYGIADTGSDLVWTQCVPCDGCYNQTNPMFDPLKSATYTDVYCESEQCRLINTVNCSQSTCSYTYGYLDSSTTKGAFGQEKVTMTSTSGETVSVGIAFGCGHNNTGVFNEREMGIIELGGGPVSFVSQIGSTFGSKRFSHCLLPFGTDVTDPSIASKISFGNGGEVVGDGVVSTPLVAKDFKTSYFVTLEAISVGDGNMFLDSGTPPTVLPQDFYDRLAAEVQKQINANMQLKPIHTFVPPKDGVYCFAMQGSKGGGIYGNFAQANFLIGFDMETMILSFKPTDCTK